MLAIWEIFKQMFTGIVNIDLYIEKPLNLNDDDKYFYSRKICVHAERRRKTSPAEMLVKEFFGSH